MVNDSRIRLVLWSRKKADNTYPVKIRITINRKASYLHTHVSVTKSEWNKSKEIVKDSNPSHAVLNQILKEEKQKAIQLYRPYRAVYTR